MKALLPSLAAPSSLTFAECATLQRNVSTYTARATTTADETTTLVGEHAIGVAFAGEHAIEAAFERFMAHLSSSSPEEEDGYDEYIIPLDAINPTNNDVVLNDVLRQCLVLPLRPRAKLVAIFDCCHSATLLDLKYFCCHRIGTWASRSNLKDKPAAATPSCCFRVHSDTTISSTSMKAKLNDEQMWLTRTTARRLQNLTPLFLVDSAILPTEPRLSLSDTYRASSNT